MSLRLGRIIRDPIVQIVPGQVAFSLLLSLIPFIALMAVIAGWFSLSIDSIITFVKSSLPPETGDLIIPLVDGKGLDAGIVLFIITSFLLASNGFESIISVSNVIYKVRDNRFIRRKIKAILLTFMIMLLLGFLLLIPTFGGIILHFLKEISFIKPIYSHILFIYNSSKIPFSLVFIFFIVKIIYTVSPSYKIKSKETTYGSIFATVLLVFISQVYSFYVVHFNNYNILYGGIANLIILLLWFYLLSYVLVIGIGINASFKLDELNQPKEE